MKGVMLPEHWQYSIALLNPVSLLDCLTQINPKQESKQCADILSLIQETLHIFQK